MINSFPLSEGYLLTMSFCSLSIDRGTIGLCSHLMEQTNLSPSITSKDTCIIEVKFLLQELIRVELLVALAAYPPAKSNFGIAEVFVDISVINKPLDGLYPTSLDVWPTFNLFDFLSILRHGATDAPDAGVSFVIELAMRYAVHIKELPHVTLRPIDDG